MSNVIDKFVRYLKIDTRSDENSENCPSTEIQWDLAHLLADELKLLGIQDITLDENCYLMATLPSNVEKEVPTIGFIAHLDTSPDMSGTNVKPQFVEHYDGKDIILNSEKDVVLSPDVFPELKIYIGQTLITTDGTTLLGSDDKAGIAEIMTALEHLTAHPEIKHGTIKIGFTPDEEIVRGVDRFDLQKFNADFAYTVDGGEVGELEYECFNAAEAVITIQGRNVHPGTAKDKMINAIHIAMELNSLLPENERPEYTSGYAGFYHLRKIQGVEEEATMTYLIRDHDRKKFEDRKSLLEKSITSLNQKYKAGIINLRIKDQYYNMKEQILPVIHIVEIAKQAMKEVGVKPLISPIRGGTDGARLSYLGLPTPNLFTGGHNFHGKYEFIPTHSMEKAVEVILKIINLYTLK